MRHLKLWIFPVLIVISACVFIVAASWNESLTYDEVTYIPSGYSYVSHGDMHLNPEHPPLFKDMAGLPLLFMDIRQDAFSTRSWNGSPNEQWNFGREFLFTTGNDAYAIARAARLPMLFFFAAAAAALFVWTRMRYGITAAYMALIVFCFSPSIMAHAGFVTNDIASMCGAIIGLFGYAYFLRYPSLARALVASLGLGFALLTKFSNVLLIPLFFAFSFVYAFLSWKRKEVTTWGKDETFSSIIAKTCVIYIVAIFGCVYPLYALHTFNYPPEKQRQDTEEIMSNFPSSDTLIWLSDKPVARPLTQFILGISLNIQRTNTGTKSYLAGHISDEPSRIYFPLAYTIKEPLPWIMLVVAGAGLGIFRLYRRISPKEKTGVQSALWKYQDELLIVAWLISYGGLSIAGNLTIGIRHIFPLYPFIIMLVCGAIMWAIHCIAHHHKTYGPIASAATWIIIIWYVIENLLAFPFYLPYFNQFVGGSANGGAYLNDSNVDWGQEMIRLRAWLDANNVAKIEGDIFTSADLWYYLGDRFVPLYQDKYSSAEDFIARSQTEWIAISESTLREKWAQGHYGWLHTYEPVTVIGHAMRVYRITAGI